MKCYLSIGSNEGNKRNNIIDAYNRISELGDVNGSSIYRTEPWGREEQPEFFNACLGVDTEKNPQELLLSIKDVEQDMGRKNKEKWSSRIIDIDVLLVEDLIYFSPGLRIPHKYLWERRFYLEPLSEIAGNAVDPVTGKRIKVLLNECEDEKKVWKIGTIL